MPSSFKRFIAISVDYLLVFIVALILLKILGFFINPEIKINTNTEINSDNIVLSDREQRITLNEQGITVLGKDGQSIIMDSQGIRINGQNINSDQNIKISTNFDLINNSSELSKSILMQVLSSTLTDILFFLLVPIFWYKLGKTPAKIIFNYKVVDFETKEDITLGQSFLRALGYFLCTLTLGIGFLMVPLRRDKRGLHDLIANTCVIVDNSNTKNLNNV